ncbi:Slam-dependent surface lipoprotein [Sphingomonas sp. ZT3P38]|uniref:Slam-dependent surface lipoprotein n=1 Tax=Parasphingomonas zepuensis TaxID=3096161 RepID=UPI002FC637F6
MKFAHLKALGLALALSSALAGTAQAQVVGGSSDATKVKIAASTVVGGPHSAGKVGINVPALLSTQYIDFQGLQAVLGSDGNGVTTFTSTTGTITDHSQYGRFDFAKVSGQDIYFGEWTQTGSASAGDHTVYYGGTGASTSVPSSGSATYSVKGISDYQNRGILTGTFTANFTGSGGTLSGSLANSGSTYGVNIGTANITTSGTFSGSGASATGSGGAPLASSGVVSGRFFGSNVNALAGLVAFSGANRQYSTAFGGTKN